MRCSLLRFTVVWAIALALLGLAPRVAAAYPTFQYGWSFPDADHVTITWTMVEDPAYPNDNPAWVGWDIRRTSLYDCNSTVTINPEIFLRDPTQAHTYSFTDQPGPGSYRYRIVPVDAQHQQSGPSESACDVCRHGMFDTSVPKNAAPVTVGTLEDMGWALGIRPCAGSCFAPTFFEGELVDALRPYADGKTVVRFYGYIACCSVEGPELIVDRYEIGSCDAVVPVRRATWGTLKTHYR